MTSADKLRNMVRGAYDIQQLRIQMGNRFVANYMVKLGLEPSTKIEDMSDDGKKILDKCRASYKKMTDGILNLPSRSKFKPDQVISDYAELILIDAYLNMETQEKNCFYQLEKILTDFPIYTEFLKNVRGCGPAMAAVIISEIDIHKARYPSSLHLLAGLDVAPDGKGRSMRKEHLVDREYVDKDGEIKTKKSITFKPFLKTKFMGVLSGSFLRSSSPYKVVYDNYKNRLENHPAHQEKTKLHRHNMALRYMMKRFLVDLYVAWRTLEGLEVSEEYQVAKLGIVHSQPSLVYELGSMKKAVNE